MPSSLAKVVFLKELRETLRDKRVILGVVISPLLLTPLLMGAVFFFAGKKSIEQQSVTLDVGIVELAPFPELTERLEANESLKLSRFDSQADAEQAIQSRRSRAAIVIPAEARQTFLEGGSAPLVLLYSQANENSENARSRLRSVLAAFDAEAVKQRLAAAGQPATLVRPTAVADTSVAAKEALVGFALSLIMPYIVIMGAAFGGINTAFDLCAGEKERGTMETLLVSPASRQEIVLGKLLTVCSISLLSAICSILGILIVVLAGGQVAGAVFGEDVDISYLNLAALVVIVIPLSLLTSAGLLLVSSFARNQKEAQAYIFPLIAIVLFPAVLSFIFGAESPLYTAFIPVLNIALAMKQLLGNVFHLPYFCIALGSSLAYALVAMRAATQLFKRESILFRA